MQMKDRNSEKAARPYQGLVIKPSRIPARTLYESSAFSFPFLLFFPLHRHQNIIENTQETHQKHVGNNPYFGSPRLLVEIDTEKEDNRDPPKGGGKMSKKSRKILQLLNDPHHRASLMAGINRADQDEPARIGNDQEMKILNEMNELQEFENDVCSKGAV
jgi:hypothetical protein